MIYILKHNNRKLTLIPSTQSFREMAAILSIRTGEPLISDCTEIWEEEAQVFARKPSLDGKNFSKYTLEDEKSYVILLKTSEAAERLMESAEIAETIEDEAAYERLIYPLELPRDEANVVNVELSPGKGIHIKDAELIFAGGRGIMNEESFDGLRQLAELYGASVGASRPMVDQGWATRDEQVGQTGFMVKPKVYVAFGISGAVQHISGMAKSQNIIAVNLNKTSPIFRYADYGAYSDDNSIIRNMLNIIRSQAGGA